ncbi:SKP1-like protein 20 [Capsicum annuum]|nr:SKP1-like protein 20 [Capsicum annuum]
MSGGPMAIVKPEMKSYIWLQTADGSIQQVEEEVAMLCPLIYKELIHNGMGSSKNCAILLPERVNPANLGLILEFCRFHQVSGRSNKERKKYDEKFVRLDTKMLCDLASAADSLQLRPVVDLTSRALARIIEGKTPEEIRETFHLPDDLTEEEKLEPLKNITDDPRIRLLNRLYARKRKALHKKEKLKNVEVVEEEHRVDERSVDDLLSFINSGDQGGHGFKPWKQPLQKCKESNCLTSGTSVGSSPSRNSKLQNSPSELFSSKFDLDDFDIDDELDPARQEEIDREVEDFARRLNSVWPERIQQILSLGQERKRLGPISMNGNGSLKRCTVSAMVPEFMWCIIDLLALPKELKVFTEVKLILFNVSRKIEFNNTSLAVSAVATKTGNVSVSIACKVLPSCQAAAKSKFMSLDTPGAQSVGEYQNRKGVFDV